MIVYISTSIYDISNLKGNNQRNFEDDLFFKDDQSEDSASGCGNKFISQNNFFQKSIKYKGEHKKKNKYLN